MIESIHINVSYLLIGRQYCTLHDLVVDYLHQPIDLDQSPQDYQKILNAKLINGYENKCNGIWENCPNDGYCYQNIIYHAIQAQADKVLNDLLTNFNWMTTKLRILKSLHNLRVDLKEYIEYLIKVGRVRQSLRQT